MNTAHRFVVAILVGVACLPATAHAVVEAGTGTGAGLRADGTLLVGARLIDSEEGVGGVATVIAAVRPDGTLDPAYGRQGTARTLHDWSSSLAVLPDGRARVITLSGDCDGNGCDTAYWLERFAADGTRAGVTAFGQLEQGFDAYVVHWLAPSGDGLLSLAGWPWASAGVTRTDVDGATVDFTRVGSEERPPGDRIVPTPDGGALVVEGDGVVRLDADLERLTTFGEGGRATLPWREAIPAADGARVVALGRAESGWEVARLLADGSPDPEWGSAGVAALPSGFASDRATLVVQPDGAVLVGSGAGGNLSVLRLTPSGDLDAGFGTGGIASVDFGAADRLTDLVLLPDGRIVAAGVSYSKVGDNYPTQRLAVTRLGEDGQLDEGFGEGGRATPEIDVVAPGLEIDQAPAEGSVVDHRAIPFAAHSPEAGATVECSLGDGPRRPCDAPIVFENAPHGVTGLNAWATDASGNERRATRVVYVAPDTRLEGGPAAGAPSTATFTWASATAGSGLREYTFFECRLDGGAWKACTSPHELTGLADGEHAFEVRQRMSTVSARIVDELEPARWTWRVGPEPEGRPGPPPVDGGARNGPPPPPPPPPPSTTERRAAGLEVAVDRVQRLRGRRRVAVTVGSAVPAAVRVTGRLRVPGRRRALAVRAFGGSVTAGGKVVARLGLGRRARAAVRKRGRGTLRARVVLIDGDGLQLAARTVKVSLRR